MLLLERRLDRVQPVRGPARPSTVVTDRPSAWTPNIVHDLTGTPSSSTVHAPQLVVSQPTWVPGQLELLADHVHEQLTRFDVRRPLGCR